MRITIDAWFAGLEDGLLSSFHIRQLVGSLNG